MTNSRLLAAIQNPAITKYNGGDGGQNLGQLIGDLYRACVMLGGIALLLYLAWGGLNWITAAGDEKKVEVAKDRITHAFIGMGVLVGTAAIANLAGKLFGMDLLNPSF